MKNLYFFLIHFRAKNKLVLLAYIDASPLAVSETEIEDRIIGGEVAKLGEFKGVVSGFFSPPKFLICLRWLIVCLCENRFRYKRWTRENENTSVLVH